MYEIPTTIQLDNKSYAIRKHGDFRMVLDCFMALSDEELSKEERLIACLIIFYEELNTVQDINKLNNLEEAVKKMYKFFNCELPESTKQRPKLVDWEKDAQLISAAVNKVAGKEIRLEPYVHWWTFMGYYMGIEESVFSTVISIRKKISEHKKLEKNEKEFRRDNPEYFIWNNKSIEDKEAEQLILEMWNNGGR